MQPEGVGMAPIHIKLMAQSVRNQIGMGFGRDNIDLDAVRALANFVLSGAPDEPAPPSQLPQQVKELLAAGTPTGIEAQVCADIERRQRLGIAKYGRTVADNPLDLRAWMQHAYEECLDQAIYLKRAIKELDMKGSP